MNDPEKKSSLKQNYNHSGLLSKVLMAGNLLSIICGIIYLTVGIPQFLQNVFGFILLFTYTGNLILIYINENSMMRKSPGPVLIDILGTIYLVVNIFAMAGLFAASFLISSSYSEKFIDNASLYLLLYVSFFIVFLLGLFYSYLSNSKKNYPLTTKNGNKFFSLTWGICLYAIMVLFIYLAYVLLIYFEKGPAEAIVSQFALFLSFIVMSATLLLLKIQRRFKESSFFRITGILGLLLSLIFLLPLISMPYAIIKAEKDFTASFGNDFDEKISPASQELFSENRFIIPAYFLGIPSENYVVEENVTYYEGKEGVDKGIKLYYDAYFPAKVTSSLPDKMPVLIRIHGGGWVSGGKGLRNMMQVNKYFAAQGYAVFDVEYGLTSNLGDGPGILGASEHLIGEFTLDDMVRHLGIFTRHLEEKADQYNLDLDSVFFSGASAGGHLATASALALTSGNYREIFSSELTVKGYIPFYPGNKYHKLPEIGGSPEWLDVESLVDQNSPPCLIYQGTHDGLVPPSVSLSFQKAYAEAGIEECAVLLMPFGAHASDLGFSSYYNQLFIYYMERFMAIYK